VTSNLATPELAPKYDPSAIESRIYDLWTDADVFAASAESEKDPYVIVIPLPNVTAALHMGHGLNNTIQDLLIRYRRMSGREALWQPGTDHAGIATQNVVERQVAAEGKSRHDIGREAFVERVWAHVERTGGAILEQLKSIGASCDWSRSQFTLDDHYYRAVMRAFVSLYEDDLLYRGHRVIHWCPRCLTSLSDEEAEFRERDDHLYYIKYQIAGTAGTENEYAVVATTRPETMFGDVALVHHPDDDRFSGLAGLNALIPLSNISIPIDVSERVERDFGTGVLKVTPAHDANDFDIANELDGEYDRPVIMDEHANMATVDRVPPQFQGLDRDDARKQIVQRLESEGQIDRIDPLHHSVRHCYRCGTIVEPRLSDQWFVRMKPLAEPALAAYHADQVQFVPERWGKTYEHWLTEIRDWNISRQLWWGHRIPAWYCEADGCDHITVSEEPPTECGACGGSVRQDEDVLDTWFSSWLWPFATMGWPDSTPDLKKFYPGNTLVTSPDIIFFWVARMIMAGYYFLGERPFKTVFLHGVVRDTKHRKMSKSLGNGIDPLEVVETFGADAMRYSIVLGAALGTDVILDPNNLEGSFGPARNFANKVWNLGRLILSHLNADSGSMDDLDAGDLELADRWILSRTQHAVTATTNALDRYRVNDAAEVVYHFIWDDLADWYVEQVKPRLYGNEAGGDVARRVLHEAFATALALLHPTMPFITEELWQHLPTTDDVLARAPWPTANTDWIDADAERAFGLIQEVVGAVRTIRAEYRIPPGTSVQAWVQLGDDAGRAAIDAERNTIERLAKVEGLTVGNAPDEVGAHAVLRDGSSVFVALGNAIDVEKECARLSKERDRLEQLVTGLTKKLANERFTSQAPAEVVARERAKGESWQEQRDALSAKLRSLGC
jgi:valyl-tRNA synthetase